MDLKQFTEKNFTSTYSKILLIRVVQGLKGFVGQVCRYNKQKRLFPWVFQLQLKKISAVTLIKNSDTRYVHDIFGNDKSGTLLLGDEEVHYDQLT